MSTVTSPTAAAAGTATSGSVQLRTLVRGWRWPAIIGTSVVAAGIAGDGHATTSTTGKGQNAERVVAGFGYVVGSDPYPPSEAGVVLLARVVIGAMVLLAVAVLSTGHVRRVLRRRSFEAGRPVSFYPPDDGDARVVADVAVEAFASPDGATVTFVGHDRDPQDPSRRRRYWVRADRAQLAAALGTSPAGVLKALEPHARRIVEGGGETRFLAERRVRFDVRVR